MIRAFLNWLDDRTGIRDFVHGALYEEIPGGARWRYVWGSTLVFTFLVQTVTGIFLWMGYSPSAQTAWESVFYLQHETQGGWLLRGLHHFTAQAMVILLVLHLMQVVIDGAYRAPREVNFWLGLVLMLLILGLALTGYLLPWDQKGYWATSVATNLMSLAPKVGDGMQQLVVGGSDYGNHTLTRFFALHAGVLPGLLIFFLILHVYMFRRHGVTHRLPAPTTQGMFWPDQVLKDGVACLAVLAVVLLLIAKPAFSGGWSSTLASGSLGAELGPPADPAAQYSAARPEWYFLFLYQLLKYFPGRWEVVGAIIVPTIVLAILAAMPIVGRWRLGHRFNIGFLGVLFVGILALTISAWRADRNDPDYQRAVSDAEADAQRASELAESPNGIPPTGMLSMMRSDPKTQGKKLFAQNCAVCHEQLATLPQPLPKREGSQQSPLGAPHLEKFASREWISGLLDPKQVAGPRYFGRTAHKDGDMVEFVTDELSKWNKEDVENVVIALSAEAALPYQSTLDARDLQRIAAGAKLITAKDGCAQCHKFHDAGDFGAAPDLTGYGSRAWIMGMIRNPAREAYYGENNDRMPAFAPGKPGSPENQLTAEAIGMLADWLRHEWYEPSP